MERDPSKIEIEVGGCLLMILSGIWGTLIGISGALYVIARAFH